ncbi:MAG: hypothetical protein M1834_004388 [Cirrosporium novae-zelandiae]|nr:MAG: hypothetical protein M1834_004388 [Cirrosporium novae-zelandiae]
MSKPCSEHQLTTRGTPLWDLEDEGNANANALWDDYSDQEIITPSCVQTKRSRNQQTISSETNPLKHLTRQVEQKSKNIACSLSRIHNGDHAHGRSRHDLHSDPAFNPNQLLPNQRPPLRNTRARARTAAKKMAATVKNPKKAIKVSVKEQTAGKLSIAPRPYLGSQADQEFLKLQDEHSLQRAIINDSSHATSKNGDKATKAMPEAKVNNLEEHRNQLQVAWITGKHVNRVRVVPYREIEYPRWQDYQQFGRDGKLIRHQWEKWLGHLLLYHAQDFSSQYIDDFNKLPFDFHTFSRTVERLVMVSAPWQAWYMSVRSITRWEDPKRTAKWAVLYIALWYSEHIMGFLYGYIIYIVIRNRIYHASIEDTKESLKRALDRRQTALHFGEVVDKHGRDGWLEPLLEELGPYIQLQVGDFANLLEVLANFYNWRSPKNTAYTLITLSTCLLITLFCDMAYCMKIIWFLLGMWFFMCRPVASLYPKYRYLVSPVKWVLWNIPTNAEWSFQYLRRKAGDTLSTEAKNEAHEKHHGYFAQTRSVSSAASDSSHGDDEHGAVPTPKTPTSEHTIDVQKARMPTHGDSKDNDDESGFVSSREQQDSLAPPSLSGDTESLTRTLGDFKARCNGETGRLLINPYGLSFKRHFPFPAKEIWCLPFLDIIEIKKLKSKNTLKLTTGLPPTGIEFVDIEGVSEVIEAIDDRDEVFNLVVAFSGCKWMPAYGEGETEHHEEDHGSDGEGDGRESIGGVEVGVAVAREFRVARASQQVSPTQMKLSYERFHMPGAYAGAEQPWNQTWI